MSLLEENSHISEERLIEMLYEAPSVSEAAHLEACETCRAEWSAYRRTVEAAQTWTAPERGPEFEAAIWQRISAALPGTKRSIVSRIPSRAWGLAAAVAVAAIVGLLVHVAASSGKRSLDPASEFYTQADSAASQRVLQLAVRDHLERTSRVLSELQNTEPNSSVIDISEEQESIEDLIMANRLYRQTAEQQDDRRTAALLREMEPVLVELAHGPSQVSAAQLGTLQQEVGTTGILFKIRVFTSPEAPISTAGDSYTNQL